MAAKKKNLALDIAERVGWTYLQAFFGLWVASGLGIQALTDLSMADKALAAILPAALSLIKGVAASRVGDSDSAAMLPGDADNSL